MKTRFPKTMSLLVAMAAIPAKPAASAVEPAGAAAITEARPVLNLKVMRRLPRRRHGRR